MNGWELPWFQVTKNKLTASNSVLSNADTFMYNYFCCNKLSKDLQSSSIVVESILAMMNDASADFIQFSLGSMTTKLIVARLYYI